MSATLNLEITLLRFFDYLGVPVNRNVVFRYLQDHPRYPSLLALSDCLNEWGVQNQTFQFQKEKITLEGLSKPFVAHLWTNRGDFVLVTDANGSDVTFADEVGEGRKMAEKDFLLQWDGIALYGEASEASREKNYLQNRIERVVEKAAVPLLIGIALLFFVTHSVSGGFNPLNFFACLMKLIGLSVSIMLLVHGFDEHNPFVRNVCGIGGGGCDSVLKSKAARISSWLSWSEVGFFYFSGGLLVAIFAPHAMGILAWLNALSLPYTVYSLSYQFRKRTWCALCCCVQAILWAEFAAFAMGRRYSVALSLSDTAMVLAFFFGPAAAWFALRPIFARSAQLGPAQRLLKRFKYDSAMFSAALRAQPRYELGQDVAPVVFGNEDAHISVTLVSNPFCIPCSTAHETLESLLKSRDDIRVQILFVHSGVEHELGVKVLSRLHELNRNGDKQLLHDALREWFRGKGGYKKWLERFPSTSEVEPDILPVLDARMEWCAKTDSMSTPAFFLNGYKLPELYSFLELKHFVDIEL